MSGFENYNQKQVHEALSRRQYISKLIDCSEIHSVKELQVRLETSGHKFSRQTVIRDLKKLRAKKIDGVWKSRPPQEDRNPEKVATNSTESVSETINTNHGNIVRESHEKSSRVETPCCHIKTHRVAVGMTAFVFFLMIVVATVAIFAR